jgi:pyruvate-ferredoxin/flavodoxin oxidoreductase
MEKKFITCDGNTACSNISYLFSEVAAIYPITPSTSMGEMADEWASKGKLNLFGNVVKIQEMQSEAGAAGAIHGSLTAGCLTTTYTASQGLLLMLPNMFKIAGEMLPTVFHVAARSLACQSLSIFCDHSDVMVARGTGFTMLCSANVQEAQDLAVISHLTTLESSIPVLHFFDGFRTSSEIVKIEAIDENILKEMINYEAIKHFKSRAIRPESPYAKVGAQNPDVYFQGRETTNNYYTKLPQILKEKMNLFAQKTGRQYKFFQYFGEKNPEKIIISMGSSTDTLKETIKFLNGRKENVGFIKVSLFRPFSIKDFLNEIPKSVKKIAVLDRTKEPGSNGEPLYLDVVNAINSSLARELGFKGENITIIGGRYGLSSKEFTPSMIKAVYDHLDNKCSHNFTVGINDDLSHLSIPINEYFECQLTNSYGCKFWGYGSDGTVGANKSAIKIIGNNTPKFVQAYFEYDSKKSGGVTVSHLRFGDEEICSKYEVKAPDFVALHKPSYIGRYDVLEGIKQNGIFLINSSYAPEEIFETFTKEMQKIIIERKIKVYTIDALKIAKEVGLKNRINTIMETIFFKLTKIIPFEKAIVLIKEEIKHNFEKKGTEIIDMNLKAVDLALNQLKEVSIKPTNKFLELPKLMSDDASEFEKNIILPIMQMKGNEIPVSQMVYDGVVPTNTTRLEKREIAEFVPNWISQNCIQCGQCAFVCPHSAIRIKQINPKDLENKNVPKQFNTIISNTKNNSKLQFKVQVYPQDCTGCGLCIKTCPTKNKSLEFVSIQKSKENGEIDNQKFFESLPEDVVEGAIANTIKESQLKQPLMEFSGACMGCGETQYLKLLTQMFGKKMIIANATGCSSIYGGTFPTIPFAKTKDGLGPAWANSLFEDNAEYGFGMRLAIDQIRIALKKDLELLLKTGTTIELKDAIKNYLDNYTDKEKVDLLAQIIKENLPKALSVVYGESEAVLKRINDNKDYLIDKSIWIVGGDGWAYDIGFGGLDHVLAQGKNVHVFVVDNEQYANTGGQASKATPRGASAKFAVAGKLTPKKNLGLMMMSYGNVYVASINLSANKMQAIKAIKEAGEYDGPSIIIAYSNCISHGFDMDMGEQMGKDANDSGYWPIYRYNPTLDEPLIWESQEPKLELNTFLLSQNRFSLVKRQHPEIAEKLFSLNKLDNEFRNKIVKNFNSSNDKKEDVN